jgi:hypothetical protein
MNNDRVLPKPTVEDLETHFFLYVVRFPNYDFRCRDCDEFTNEFAIIPVTAGCEDAYEFLELWGGWSFMFALFNVANGTVL